MSWSKLYFYRTEVALHFFIRQVVENAEEYQDNVNERHD